MKNFLLQTRFEPIFFTGSLAVFNKERGEPAKSGWLFLAAAGGEIRSNYFQYSAHFSKSQRFMGRLASLGGQIERKFPAKT